MSLKAHAISVLRGGRRILSDVSLELAAGELLVVVGPNGAGKSTLLAALAGDGEVDEGEVTLDDRALDRFELDELAERRAVVGTPPRLAFDYTVRDVVAMGWLHGDRYGLQSFGEALGAVLEANELEELARRTYMTLSSGERQRAEYARACLQLWRPEGEAGQPSRWLLLDEPTANLDVAHGVAMLESFAARARAGDGVLAVLHDLDLAARFADRVALLAGGELIALGAPAEVLTAERLTRVYGTPIHVEQHAALNRLVVIG
ncbi:MAG: heme ABC transporter ATP-binding protein [Halieaceae bacterium]|jgi:iron complex transport system ATP-binding protein|nr:heme ABC transporter ATP-binding protein [Halieaceae bacterium]